MHVCMLIIEFHLDGCQSLKEKRRRLAGLRDRLGRASHLALCESGFQDNHQRAQWTFVALGASRAAVEHALEAVEEFADTHLDAVISHRQREVL